MPNVPAGVERKDLSWYARIWERFRGGEEEPKPIDVPLTDQAQQPADAKIPPLGERDFGPLPPLHPRAATDSAEQTAGPRQFQYLVGQNIIVAPRREHPDLTPFEQLRNLASLYDVAAMCIGSRIEEMQGLDWSVVSVSKRKQKERQDDCDECVEFFQSPDRLNGFAAWLGMLLYDVLSIDALTLYRRPDMGGRLYSLEPVDGATIKPLLDDRGRTSAYQQVLYGYPFSDYKRPTADRPDESIPTYSTNQLIYKPRWVRSFTPYGFPPTEWVILRVNQALRKQSYDIAYFTDGNIPDMIATPPEGDLDPTQVQQFEENFNAILEGNERARRKVRFFAWNMNLKELREFTYTTTLDEWMMRITCGAYGKPPSELGFTDNVNRSNGEIQQAINDRRGIRPLSKWLTSEILNPSLMDLGGKVPAKSLPATPTRPARQRFVGLTWWWGFGDTDDYAQIATADRTYWDMGVGSEDEFRALRFGDVFEGPAPGSPLRGQVALGMGVPSQPSAGNGQQVTAPPTVSADKPAAESASDTTENIASVALNGAQVAAATSIVKQVAEGSLPRDSAKNMLMTMFAMTPEQAEGILGSAGKTVKPEARPSDTGGPFRKGSKEPTYG